MDLQLTKALSEAVNQGLGEPMESEAPIKENAWSGPRSSTYKQVMSILGFKWAH